MDDWTQEDLALLTVDAVRLLVFHFGLLPGQILRLPPWHARHMLASVTPSEQ